MYLNYFGLSEASFSITPDPHYLFLSEQHREALAHLLYGAGENGGFVMLTGEVGTGKTTVCRAFLEQTPAEVDVALVLNPAMTAIELMHAICQEFGVSAPENQDSVKVLVDRLNRFLLDAYARGRRSVLVIDEAQNLCPRVLEQVRLLTNLETAKRKLLQIFLIGQPELRDLLATAELRQLNQRITARFHLSPLSASETAAYIEHRIAIAGVDRPLFTPAALREVHRRSRGVPRLINLICDRSLLGAAVSRRMQVSPRIVRRASQELLGGDTVPHRPIRSGQRQPLALAASVLVALVLGAWIGASGLVDQARQGLDDVRSGWASLTDEQHPNGPEVEAAQRDSDADAASIADAAGAGGAAGSDAASAEGSASAPLAQGTTTASAATAGASRPDAADGATDATPSADRTRAIPRITLARIAPQVPEVAITDLAELTLSAGETVPALAQRWGLDAGPSLGCGELDIHALDCERSQVRWSDLRLFDRPVALQLQLDGEERYAVIGALDDEYAVLHRADRSGRVPIASLDERWSGDVLMLWRTPPSGSRLIGPGDSGESVLWLRQQLAALPDASLSDIETPGYDAGLREAVRAFQSGRGLVVDGIAGPQTLVMLNNALADAAIPRLSQSRAAGASAP